MIVDCKEDCLLDKDERRLMCHVVRVKEGEFNVGDRIP